MKFSFNKLASITAIVVFIGYWLLIPILTIPHIPEQKKIAAHFPFVSKTFATNWQFFAKSWNYNDRMHIIIRKKNDQAICDTFEVLKAIYVSKQNAAPFNQKENIIDHFANYYVSNIKRLVSRSRDELHANIPGQPDSFYRRHSIQLAKEKKLMKPDSIALHNFCRAAISRRVKNTSSLEFKFILSYQLIPKFERRFQKDQASPETFFFETGYSNY
jgi:hypothetical protein